MIPFPFNENRFSFFFFFFFADHLLVGQLYTNPKSDRSLLSCLKVTQCSTSEIGDAPLYNACSLPIQVMTTGSLRAPSKCKPRRFNVPRVIKTKFPATVMVSGVVSSEGHIMPPHIFEVDLKVNTKVYVRKSVMILWCNQVAGGRPWVAIGLGAGPQVQRDPSLASEGVLRLCTLLSLATHLPRHELVGHMSRTSPTRPPTTPKPAWSPPSTEYSPSSHQRLWERCSQFRIRIEAVIEAEGGYIE